MSQTAITLMINGFQPLSWETKYTANSTLLNVYVHAKQDYSSDRY